MEKFQNMKTFISTAKEYSQHPTEKITNALQRQLQILGVTSDMSLFDPASCVAAEFYVSLHELMSVLESRSGLVWCAIGVLHHACRNPAARHSLIHTYKFAPILTRLLGTNLIQDKRIRVLQLLQELTYGVKISWQEAHLPYLISTLTSWIVGGEKDVIILSLGVLVNLCYKNLPAVYTLMRSVDSKQFLRTILKLQNDNINTRVQVCKLLIILEHISGEIPDTDILNFVSVTFSTVGDAFKTNDMFLLRHMVDFFKDVQTNPHSKEVLLTYRSFPSDTEQLLLLLDNDRADHGCVGVLFEFLYSLVTLKVAGLSRLYPRLVALAMHWITSPLASTQSLSLIRLVVEDMRYGGGDTGAGEVQLNVMSGLEEGLSDLLEILRTGRDENFTSNSDTRTRITALLQLLQEMCRTQPLRQKILHSLELQVIQYIFQPLLAIQPREGENLFQGEVTDLYVHALDLMSDLASHDGQWLKLYSDILQYRQVHMVLAVALYTGTEDIKRRVLTLTSTVGFPAESVAFLAKSLCDLEPLVLVESNSVVRKVTSGVGSSSGVQHDMTPLFTLAQEGRLDHFISKLEEALERNEIQDISTSAVMELYEYKIAAMGHAERALQQSLEAANNHSTHLHHRLAQMSAEASKLHQLLYHNQQCIEGLQQEKNSFISRIEAAQMSAEDEHRKHISEIKAKQRMVNELNGFIEELKRNIIAKEDDLSIARQQLDALNKQNEEIQTQYLFMEQKNKDQLSKISDMTKTLSKLEDRISKRERVIEGKMNDIDKLQKTIQALEVELNNYKMLCKAQEKNLQEKETEMIATQQHLSELQRMRDVIYEISAGKKKVDK